MHQRDIALHNYDWVDNSIRNHHTYGANHQGCMARIIAAADEYVLWWCVYRGIRVLDGLWHD